jgi:hypothetical protein
VIVSLCTSYSIPSDLNYSIVGLPPSINPSDYANVELVGVLEVLEPIILRYKIN